MRRPPIAAALLILWVVCTATGACAGQTPLKVVFMNWFPYTYMENGEAKGFEVEIFKAVLGQMGLAATYACYPWKRCLATLETGHADALVSLMRTAKRERYTIYPDEYISISNSVFVKRADSPIVFNGNLKALRKFSVGTIMGFSYGDAFDQAGCLKKDPALNCPSLIRKLLAGRNDVAAENQAVISGYARKMGVTDRICILRPPINTDKLYVGFPKVVGRQELAERFSTVLNRFKKSAAYLAILETYGVTASQLGGPFESVP